MSPDAWARAEYKRICGRPQLIAKARAEFDTIAEAMSGANGGMQITSSNVNGQGFTAKFTGDHSERYHRLSRLMTKIDNGSAGGTSTIAAFR